jgi:hypothetical protein
MVRMDGVNSHTRRRTKGGRIVELYSLTQNQSFLFESCVGVAEHFFAGHPPLLENEKKKRGRTKKKAKSVVQLKKRSENPQQL